MLINEIQQSQSTPPGKQMGKPLPKSWLFRKGPD